MFAPPPVIPTTVFARVPDSLRIKGGSTPWINVQRGGAPTDCFLEGPSFDREGRLYVVDVAWGRIFRVSPGGEFEVYTEYDGEPNGLKIHRDGRIFVADYRHGIMVVDPDTREVRPLLERGRGGMERFKGVNDLVFSSSGDLYFTDQGLTGMHDPSGCLYRYRSDGRLDCLVDNIPSPNGLVLSLDERTVFVNVTRGNCVWRVPLNADGLPFKVGIFIQMSGSLGGPDGLAIDTAGNLAVAQIGMGAVWVFSPLGEPLARIQSCEGLAVTNLAYGGPDNTELYITESESGTILKAQLQVPGRRMYSHS